MKSIKQKDIHFETGDILLFHGKKTCFEKAIQCCTSSQYSHVAVILNLKKPYNGLEEGVYCIESGYEYHDDEISKKRILGVQIQKLSTIIEQHSATSDIFYRKLHINQNYMTYEELDQTILSINDQVHEKPYDINPIDWIKAEIRTLAKDFVSFDDQKINVFWCSALVSYIYVRLGLLPGNIPWTLVSPEEWGSEHSQQLPFINCFLDLEKKIKIRKSKLYQRVSLKRISL